MVRSRKLCGKRLVNERITMGVELTIKVPWLDFAFDRNIKTEVGRLLMYPWMALLPLSMLLTLTAFLVRTGLAGDRQAR